MPRSDRRTSCDIFKSSSLAQSFNASYRLNGICTFKRVFVSLLCFICSKGPQKESKVKAKTSSPRRKKWARAQPGKLPVIKKSQVVVNTTTDFFYQAWNPFHLKEIYKGPPPGSKRRGWGVSFIWSWELGFRAW